MIVCMQNKGLQKCRQREKNDKKSKVIGKFAHTSRIPIETISENMIIQTYNVALHS